MRSLVMIFVGVAGVENEKNLEFSVVSQQPNDGIEKEFGGSWKTLRSRLCPNFEAIRCVLVEWLLFFL